MGGSNSLVCSITGGGSKSLLAIVSKIKRMFDVDALPSDINQTLKKDSALAPLVKANPGLRLPGAFDEFETAVRAIVGQQISVKGATTVMGRIRELYGSTTHLGPTFPLPEQLMHLDPEELPMPRKRAEAIREMSRRVASGELRFDIPDEDEFMDAVTSIPGIGPWTAQYISLRARTNPDSFLFGDLVIKKVADRIFNDNSESLDQRSEAWRPWRGYAGMHMWRFASELAAKGVIL